MITGAYAQDNLSVSLFGGTSQYLGDINKTNPVYKPSPNLGVAIKAHTNLRSTLGFVFSYNSLQGRVGDFDDFVHPTRDSVPNRFSEQVADFSVNMEFNFMPYEVYDIRHRNFTPYVFAGVGTNYYFSGQENQFPLIIPFGLGIKYNIFERFSVGMEWSAKKTFFDGTDGVTNISESGDGSILHNNDWYHHAVIFISFNPFRQKIDCPTYWE
jgi:hypothetical protein